MPSPYKKDVIILLNCINIEAINSLVWPKAAAATRTDALGRSRPFKSAYQVAELGKSRTVTTDRSRPDADIRRDDRSLTSRTRHVPMAKLQQAKLRYEFGLVLAKNVDAGTEERVPASGGRTKWSVCSGPSRIAPGNQRSPFKRHGCGVS